MGINDIKELFGFLTNKYQLGDINGYEFNALFKKCSLSYFSFLVGNAEQYAPGRPVPRIGLGMGENIGTKLSRFVVPPTPLTCSQGVVSKPDNFYRLLNMQTPDGDDIRRAEPNVIATARKSTIVPIETNPRFVEYDSFWLLYPSTYATASVQYLRLPADAYWNFITVGNREQFNPTQSIDPEWDDVDVLRIIGRMMADFGVVVKDGELMQYGQTVKQTGE